ncbi:MAG: YHS domain-containing protein [Candidatus Methanomethylicia archaeon]
MKVVDPVCGMDVDSNKTPFKTIYKGKIYYFCSMHCKRVFEENPEYYLKHGPIGMHKL